MTDLRPETVPVSVCICTRHRAADLRTCLHSCFGGPVQPAEVIVSDDGDPGQEVEAVARAFPRVLYQRGPRAGLSANRNACLARATSPWVLFVDDDVTIPPQFFMTAQRLIAALREPERTILSGTQWDVCGDERVQMFPRNADFWGFQQKVPAPGDHRSFVINATLMPRTLFRKAQFDPQLRYGSDEIDMARHAVAVGFRIEFHPELQVEHRPAKSNRTEYAKVVHASRLYAAGKAHWRYERSWGKTLLYFTLAPMREVLAHARRRGVKGAMDAIRSVLLAGRYFFASTAS